MTNVVPLPGSLDSHDLAWAAGIFDGEGSVGAYTWGESKNLRVSIQVGNTCLLMISKFHDMFGGYVATTKKARKNGQPYYTWRCRSGYQEFFLRSVLPYLVTKREQAEVALTFLGTKDRSVHANCAEQLRFLKKKVS